MNSDRIGQINESDVILTWEKLGDDLVLHDNMRNVRLDLDSFPGQLSKDLLTEQNVLSGLQLHVPCLGAYYSYRDKGSRMKRKKSIISGSNAVITLKNRTASVFSWSPEQVKGSQITDIMSLFLDGNLKSKFCNNFTPFNFYTLQNEDSPLI